MVRSIFEMMPTRSFKSNRVLISVLLTSFVGVSSSSSAAEQEHVTFVGCDNSFDENGRLISVCKYQISTSNVGIPLAQNKYLIGTNTMISKDPVENTSATTTELVLKQTSLELVRVVDDDDDKQPSDHGRITSFHVKWFVWLSMNLVKHLKCEIRYFNFTMVIADVVAINSTISSCVRGGDGTGELKILGKRDALVSSFPVDVDILNGGLFVENQLKKLFRFYRNKYQLDDGIVLNFESSFVGASSLKFTLSLLAGLKIKRLVFEDSKSLRHIGGKAYWDFPELEYLSLAGNVISAIDPSAFDNLVQIETLDLSRNRFASVPNTIFSLPTLKILDLTDNEPADGRSFEISDGNNSTSALETLLLSDTPLANLEGLSRFPRVQILDLRRTSVRAVSSESLSALKSLRRLDLSENHLETVDPEAFDVPRSLEILSMSSCNLDDETIAVGMFENLDNLMELKMDRNVLTEMKIFWNFDSVDVADLSHNRLVAWHVGLLRDRPLSSSVGASKRLSLRNNDLSEVTVAMIADFEHFGSGVDLEGNPFDCRDCSLETFKRWIETGNSTIDNHTSLVCQIPTDHRVIDVPIGTCTDDTDTVLILALVFGTIATVFLIMLLNHFKWYLVYLFLATKSRIRKSLRRAANDNDFAYDAFISYCAEDRRWIVDELVPNLEGSTVDKLNLCIHERNFIPGAPITDNIIASIDTSRKVLLIVSNKFVESRWCLFEAHLAQHRMFEDCRDSLILVKLEALEAKGVPKSLAYLLRTRTHLEWPTATGTTTDDDDDRRREDKLHKKRRIFWQRLKNVLNDDLKGIMLSPIPIP